MGRINLLAERPRQSDSRRRGGRAAGIGRQGAHRKRHRRRRAPHPGLHRAGRQAARTRRGRRRRDEPGRCAAFARAPRHEQDSARRRSRRDSHPRIPRRSAAQHRVGIALRHEDAAARRALRAPRYASTEAPSPPFRRSARRRALRSKSAICSTTCRPGANFSRPTRVKRRRCRGWSRSSRLGIRRSASR